MITPVDILIPAIELWAVKEGKYYLQDRFRIFKFEGVAQKYTSEVIPQNTRGEEITPDDLKATTENALRIFRETEDEFRRKAAEHADEGMTAEQLLEDGNA